MEKLDRKNMTIDILRGSILSVIFSIILTLLLSIMIHYIDMNLNVVNALNITTRALSIVLGVCIGIRTKSKGMLKGFCIALVHILLTYIVYGLIAKDFSLSIIKLLDAISIIFFGIISGIIAVNLKSK